MEEASNWRSLFSCSIIVVLPSLLNLVCSCCKFAYAIDTLLPGQFLNANQSLVSKNGAFKLGFDCANPLDDSYSFCGFGIWFNNSSSCKLDYYIPIWRPDLNPGGESFLLSYNLSVLEEGLLQITDGHYSWSSSYTRTTSISAIAVLLDNGNLVIRDRVNSSVVIWQSFDYPSNVLLTGGHLGFNNITGKNVNLTSIFSTYTLSLDATRRRGFIIRGYDRYDDQMLFTGTFPRWMDIHEDGDHALAFNDAHALIQLNNSGFVSFTKRSECNNILWSAPDSLCDLNCGPYRLLVCERTTIYCKSIGFDDVGVHGYWRKVPLNCGNAEVSFHPIDGIRRYPQNALTFEVTNMSECESSCLKNCSCTAFAYTTSCLLWFSELRNTAVFDSNLNGNRMYIRIPTKLPGDPFQKRVVFKLMIGVLALVVIGLVLFWTRGRKLFSTKTKTVGDNRSLTVFSFVQIKNSTKKFSDKLGEGGYGCVFKGMLPGLTFVAVKKLKGLRQDDKQFRAEVQTIGMIQHINIVRLLGFCAEDSGKFLVYEYMTNGSLSNHLFSKSSSKLRWELRYSIALGIARGLAYLHEGCKDCILHCDIKPDNMLLDAEFCPKVADFGMAKLLGRDYSRVLTTMRGTIGYLAPEWISGAPITYKADVYSYGMMLFEIISGRRNSEKIKEGRFTYFPIYAAVMVNEGDVMCLLDSGLEGNADAEQLERACRVACWCIQDAEDHRPMMGQVVHMLEGVMDVRVPPVPRSLQNFVGMEDSTSADCYFSQVSC